MRRRGFTLVELLAVVGIIGVLIAILLPVLGRAREHANRVKCVANLRQLAFGAIAYSQENRGRYPASAACNAPKLHDWAHWQADRNFSESALATYLSGFGPELLRCPSDDPEVRPAEFVGNWTMPYRFSYSYNEHFAEVLRRSNSHTPLRNAAAKVLFVDEDEATADDGAANLWGIIIGNTIPEQRLRESLLATRHDATRYRAWAAMPDAQRREKLTRPDRADRGNAAFADGHVDYVTRALTWEHEHIAPWAP